MPDARLSQRLPATFEYNDALEPVVHAGGVPRTS
jgi:hypothetical protein